MSYPSKVPIVRKNVGKVKNIVLGDSCLKICLTELPELNLTGHQQSAYWWRCPGGWCLPPDAELELWCLMKYNIKGRVSWFCHFLFWRLGYEKVIFARTRMKNESQIQEISVLRIKKKLASIICQLSLFPCFHNLQAERREQWNKVITLKTSCVFYFCDFPPHPKIRHHGHSSVGDNNWFSFLLCTVTVEFSSILFSLWGCLNFFLAYTDWLWLKVMKWWKIQNTVTPHEVLCKGQEK